MSFLADIGTAIASLFGISSQNKQEKTQQQALQDQNKIAQQEMADKQKTYDAANSFYAPYTKEGSPFLDKIQSSSAGRTAEDTNNAAGTFRSEMTGTGTGFGPSGSTASGLAKIGAESSATSSSNYLANLLANEQIKFQAQNGLLEAGKMAGSTQNQPSVSANLQPASTTGAVGAAGNALGDLFGGNNLGPAINNVGAGKLGIPQPGSLPTTNVQTPSVLTPPTPTGWYT
jgi:hypothetical protein